MTVTAADIDAALEAVDKARKVLDARLEDLRELVSRVPVPTEAPEFACPVPACGISKASERALADHMANVHEIGRRLGVSTQRVHQLAADDDFPVPIGKAGASTLWRWLDIERWAHRVGREIPDQTRSKRRPASD